MEYMWRFDLCVGMETPTYSVVEIMSWGRGFNLIELWIAIATPLPVQPPLSARVSWNSGKTIFLFGLRLVSESNTILVRCSFSIERSSCLWRDRLAILRTNTFDLFALSIRGGSV